MINNLKDCVTLNNGLEMPWLGFGVFQMKEGAETEDSVRVALEAGYRSIDTATIYENESSVGEAIKASSIPRENIFLTTKVWNSDQRNQRTLAAFDESLKRLQTDYVDLYLIHWPVKGCYVETWKALEKLHESGLARAIGVSNFQIHHLKDILDICKIVPAINQVEFHPELRQRMLQEYCVEHRIQLEAYAPLGQGKLLSNPSILELAQKYGKTAAQILIRWDLQLEVVTIPKSSTPRRIIENSQVFDFALSAEDMECIETLNKDCRVGADPDHFDF
jgi:diketogulonate reductase-like aldo/keto reductase